MARPIKETPILTWRDATNFNEQRVVSETKRISKQEFDRIRVNAEVLKSIDQSTPTNKTHPIMKTVKFYEDKIASANSDIVKFKNRIEELENPKPKKIPKGITKVISFRVPVPVADKCYAALRNMLEENNFYQ